MQFVWIASLIGGLIQACKTIVGQVLIALGIGFFTYQGVDLILAQAHDAMFAQLGGLNSDILSMLGAMKVGSALNIVFSAVTARAGISGLLAAGKTKQFGFKGAGW